MELVTSRSLEARGPEPAGEVPTGVGLGPVGPGDLVVEVQPPVEQRVVGGPHEGAVVALAHRHQAAGGQHPPHLAQGGHRVVEVLQDLVGVDHVERAVGRIEGVDVADGQGHGGLVDAGTVAGLEGGGHHLRRGVDADHRAGCHPCGQVEGDGSGPAADVEQSLAGGEVGEQVGGGVLGRTPAVAAQDRFVVPVGVAVGHRPIVARGSGGAGGVPAVQRSMSATTAWWSLGQTPSIASVPANRQAATCPMPRRRGQLTIT